MFIGHVNASYPGNRCLELDGVNDHVGFSGEEAQHFSFELWVKPKYRIEVGSNSVYGHERGFLFSIGSTILAYFDYRSGDLHLDIRVYVGANIGERQMSYAGSRQVWEPEWYHIAVVHDNPTLTVYVNATVDLLANIKDKTPYNYSYELLYYSSAGRIGTAIDNTSLAFGGSIDEVRYWNTSRSDSEIIDAFSRVLDAPEMESSNLVGYWQLDDTNDPQECLDLSPKNVSATLGASPYTPLWISDASTPIIPEFPSTLTLLLFMTLFAVAIVLAKKKRPTNLSCRFRR
jgi:hypothetical protein